MAYSICVERCENLASAFSIAFPKPLSMGLGEREERQMNAALMVPMEH